MRQGNAIDFERRWDWGKTMPRLAHLWAQGHTGRMATASPSYSTLTQQWQKLLPQPPSNCCLLLSHPTPPHPPQLPSAEPGPRKKMCGHSGWLLLHSFCPNHLPFQNRVASWDGGSTMVEAKEEVEYQPLLILQSQQEKKKRGNSSGVEAGHTPCANWEREKWGGGEAHLQTQVVADSFSLLVLWMMLH